MRMKQIKGFEHLFACENGEIYNAKRNVYLKGSRTRGYKYVHLTKNGMFQVHRLIAEAFLPNPDNLPEVNHINGIRDDNRIDNLEWCTHEYNALDSLKRPRKNGWSIKGISMKQYYGHKYRVFHKGKSIYCDNFCDALLARKELMAY